MFVKNVNEINVCKNVNRKNVSKKVESEKNVTHF